MSSHELLVNCIHFPIIKMPWEISRFSLILHTSPPPNSCRLLFGQLESSLFVSNIASKHGDGPRLNSALIKAGDLLLGCCLMAITGGVSCGEQLAVGLVMSSSRLPHRRRAARYGAPSGSHRMCFLFSLCDQASSLPEAYQVKWGISRVCQHLRMTLNVCASG